MLNFTIVELLQIISEAEWEGYTGHTLHWSFQLMGAKNLLNEFYESEGNKKMCSSALPSILDLFAGEFRSKIAQDEDSGET